MMISEYVDGIGEDLRALGELGGPETAALAEKLVRAAEPALRTRLLTALNDVAQEFNVRDDTALTLNLEGDDVRLVRMVPVEVDASVPTPSDYSARIALRLSDELKGNIENLATEVGSSVNSWIVRTLERSVRGDSSQVTTRGTRQLRGQGRA